MVAILVVIVFALGLLLWLAADDFENRLGRTNTRLTAHERAEKIHHDTYETVKAMVQEASKAHHTRQE